MSLDKLVDSSQLDTDLTSVANAIRTKGGTSAQLAFPAGFVSAVQAIPTGGAPTGTKQISITANGTTTEDVAAYANAEITVNVPGGGGGSNKVADMFPIPDAYSLPSNYQKLAYCEATGTQIFDTGFLPTVNTKIEVAAHYLPGTYGTYLWLFGCSAPGVYVSQNGYNVTSTYFKFGNSGEKSLNTTKFYGIPIYSLSATEIRVQNPGISNQSVAISSATMPSGSDTIALLGRHNGSDYNRGAPCRFFRARIWENNVLVRWICPVLKDGTEICLYDVVNGTYMPNVGTGVLAGVIA